MAWFHWNSISNELKEIDWKLLEHHPDFIYENGVHMRKAERHTELWVECADKNMAVTKMLQNPDFRDSYF